MNMCFSMGAYLPTVHAHSGDAALDTVCGPCGTSFTMLKRKHRCRLCEVTCCDECSRKRTSLDGSKEVQYIFLVSLFTLEV